MEIKEFKLDPNSRYVISGIRYRHIADEGWLIDEESELLVYTNGKYIGYNNKVWRIPYHFKEPECKCISVCERTNTVIVDILVTISH